MPTRTWHYYDSAGSMNTHVALRVAAKMTPYMHAEEKVEWTRDMFVQEECPQQVSGRHMLLHIKAHVMFVQRMSHVLSRVHAWIHHVWFLHIDAVHMCPCVVFQHVWLRDVRCTTCPIHVHVSDVGEWLRLWCLRMCPRTSHLHILACWTHTT